MYFVKYGYKYLHDPRVGDALLIDLSLTAEENSFGYCDFTMYPTHPMYRKIKERDADNPVEVYDDDILLFSGFIYELGTEFYQNGNVKCKGELAYFAESLVRPYSTLQNGFGKQAPTGVDEYFEWLIAQHNEQVKENKRFTVGVNQGAALDSNNYIYRESTKYPTTWSELSEKLLDDPGGFLRIRHENNIRYIDYLSEWTDTNSQILDFGKNLTDYTQTDDSDNVVTFVVPLGAKMSETGYPYDDGYYKTSDTTFNKDKEYYTKSENGYSKISDNVTAFEKGVTYYEYYETYDESNLSLTIAGLDDKEYETDYRKSGDIIYCESAVQKYGWIGATYENTDITTKEALVSRGILNLKSMISPVTTIEVKAVDMHLINPDIKPIRIGEYVRVRSKPHNLDSYFLCTNIDLDLNEPANSVYTLGTTFDTLTGQQNKRIKLLNANINQTYEQAEKLTEKEKQNAQTAGEALKKSDSAEKKADTAVVTLYDEYAVSDSTSDPPQVGWGTDTPVWKEGTFIWRRVVSAYGDGHTEVGSPALMTGNTGAKGDKGDTGPQGPQGVQGVKGTDGKTYYTWIKYADSPTSGMSDNPSGKKYIGVAYNKTTATESTKYSDYSWSLIKGDKGDKGDKGETGGTGPTGPTGNGIKSITYYYARTTSQTAPSAANITAISMPTLDATNKYLWQKEVITYTNNTSQTSVLLLAVYGNTGAKGDKGDTGPAGKGISSTEVTYQASTSGTSVPTGTWATSIPSVAAGSYLWTRTIITYTDKTSTTSYAVGKMGNTGATGKGIKSTSITYQAHSNGTTAPTGTWTDLIPTTSAEKPYLWSRTILTYTDNTTSTTYSVGSTPDGVLDEIKKVLRYDDTKITLGRTGSNITLNLQNDKMTITNGEVDLMSIGVSTEESDGTTWTVTKLTSDQKLYLSSVNEIALASRILQLESFEGGIRFDVKSYQGTGQPIQFYKGVGFSQGWTQNIPTLDYGNCNEITESGYYYIGTNGKNRPENTNGWLECMKYSTNYCAQTYTTYNGKKYTRYQQNGTWGAWFRVWQSRQLFGNESQAMNTSITLSDSAANYDMLEIFYKSNDAPQNSVRVYSPNGKKVDLTSTTYIASSYQYLFVKSKQILINGTKIDTFKHSTYGNCTGEMEIRNGNVTIGKYADNVGIIRVLGWR